MRPAPAQVGQALGLVPVLAPVPEQASQATEVGIRSCAVLPQFATKTFADSPADLKEA